jgi:hypothetical protein
MSCVTLTITQDEVSQRPSLQGLNAPLERHCAERIINDEKHHDGVEPKLGDVISNSPLIFRKKEREKF